MIPGVGAAGINPVALAAATTPAARAALRRLLAHDYACFHRYYTPPPEIFGAKSVADGPDPDDGRGDVDVDVEPGGS